MKGDPSLSGGRSNINAVRFFAQWIPTFHPFSRLMLREAMYRIGVELSTIHESPGVVARFRGSILVGERQSTIAIEETGLFTVTTEPGPRLTRIQSNKFDYEANGLYSRIAETLHVNLFRYEPLFVALAENYDQAPTRPATLRSLAERYRGEVHRIQIYSDQQVRVFASVTHQTGAHLSRWSALAPNPRAIAPWPQERRPRLVYLQTVYDMLMQGRVQFSNAWRALSDCRGALAFYESFKSLHGIEPLSEHGNGHLINAYSTVADNYRVYSDFVGSFLIQFLAMVIAVIAVLQALLIPLFEEMDHSFGVPGEVAPLVTFFVMLYVGSFLLCRSMAKALMATAHRLFMTTP